MERSAPPPLTLARTVRTKSLLTATQAAWHDSSCGGQVGNHREQEGLPFETSVGIATLLADVGELLFRQVHPTWVDDGEPSWQAFAPFKKDEGKVSIARSSKT